MLDRTRTQRLFLLLAGLSAGLFVLAAGWVLVTGLLARSRLEAVRADLPELRAAVGAGDVARATALSQRIAERAGSAHQLTSGPAWWVAANVPVLGTPLQTGRTVAYQADRIGRDALPGVLDLAGEIMAPPHRRAAIDLRPLARSTTVLDAATRTVRTAARAVERSEPSWLPLVSHARADVVTELHSLTDGVATADRAVRTALPMLGAQRPQRYFLGFLNEAESRGLGGIPGAYAILTVADGRITFTRFGSDDDLFHVRARVALSRQYRALYGLDDPTGVFQNSDLSPDFAPAARIWAGLWTAKTGQRIDGALAIDPSAISYLLRVTGPATLVDGSQVSADNVVGLAQQKQYSLYGSASPRDTAARKRFLTGIAAAVAARILTTPSITGLADAARRAITERRLVVWSAVPRQEAALRDFGLGGELAAGGRPYAGFVTNNAAGGKMDFYLETAMTYRRRGCGARSTTVATLRLTNDTPDYPLPPYVTTFIGRKPRSARPGYNRLIVTYYTTPGAGVRGVRVDGRPRIVASAPENGLVSIRLLLDLPAGASRTLQVTTAEPAAHGPVQVLRQPAVRPIDVTVDAPSCG